MNLPSTFNEGRCRANLVVLESLRLMPRNCSEDLDRHEYYERGTRNKTKTHIKKYSA
jgi:hypothetical protein